MIKPGLESDGFIIVNFFSVEDLSVTFLFIMFRRLMVREFSLYNVKAPYTDNYY